MRKAKKCGNVIRKQKMQISQSYIHINNKKSVKSIINNHKL